MRTHDLATWQHRHDFDAASASGERRALTVFWITAATMLVELIAGLAFGSMALLADGWHMGTHVAAFLITLFAYRYARRRKGDPRFTFGTGKVGVLGGFASAVALAVVALVMAVESVGRLFSPCEIRFNEALGVAVLGLLVNLACALLLQQPHAHAHGHTHPHDHAHDHNLKAAYLHVVADAFTSVLAITALLCGKLFGWHGLDPAMGLVGGLVITHWALGLLRETAPILLDASTCDQTRTAIRQRIEADADNRIADLHVWQVGPDDCAAILAVVTHRPKPADHYRRLLADLHGLSHVTVEVNTCCTP